MISVLTLALVAAGLSTIANMMLISFIATERIRQDRRLDDLRAEKDEDIRGLTESLARSSGKTYIRPATNRGPLESSPGWQDRKIEQPVIKFPDARKAE